MRFSWIVCYIRIPKNSSCEIINILIVALSVAALLAASAEINVIRAMIVNADTIPFYYLLKELTVRVNKSD